MMQRAGYSAEEIQLVNRAYKLLFRGALNHRQAIEDLKNGKLGSHLLIDEIVQFAEASKRGLA
jgi:acyl-[acyl carrier protein]--UDP-N-acetylglucosamine O-acyltransferase